MSTYTSNYGWTKPSGNDNVDVSVLNNNLDNQDSTIHDAFLNMAPPFSESSTYAVDDIVLYGTGLYKCHTAVVTPGPWTGSTNWQVHKLSEGGSGGGGYVLPVATASRLGGVKIGSGISVEEDGTISASGGGSGEIKNLDNGMLSHVTDSSYITVNLDVPLTAGKEYKITIRDAQYNYVDTKQIIWTSDVDVIFPGVGSSGEYGIRLTQTTVSLYNYGGTGWRDIYCDIVSDFSSESYNDFTNKPSINGVELLGNKTAVQLGLMASDGVVANASDEATDVLQKIKIGNTVYSIPGSGGNEALLVPRGPYVDTGILGSTSGLKIQISLRVMDVEEQAIFGASWSLTGFFLMTYRGAFRFHSGNVSVDSSQISKGELYNIEATKTGVTVNGTTYALSNPSGNDDNANILLFTTPNSQGSGTSGIVYSCKMYNGDTLLRDFSPATDNNNVACLYDAVSDTYFYNLGTDEFFVM